MSLEIHTVRVSESGKEQLIKLKRYTGLKQWNTLCRWALCASLADPTPPLVRDILADSNVEMTWRTFGGEWADVYLALIKQRLLADGYELTQDNLTRVLLAHLHRGIGALAGQTAHPTIDSLVKRAVPA
ncbi:DNA sulfur modification protein DndE [Friedmanniella luteola]|uniref:DNA sulfur modification protein DndE n=1 Tax=Friedmanniella luteola TaxID=546871 RepID=A0A1H1ZM17_9ACTN|nr:DNA sulfur modification protein DndE [Friedmanniella luteola]SDT34825.1 DNA sulfur modification protein DndE [Friedmanniella luteola]